MSKQRTCELVTKIHMKSCSSLVKIISGGENIFMQNKWMKYRKVLPNHKNANMGSSTVHLHGHVERIPYRYANSRLIIKTYFYII